jgi:hypothetical protein
MADETNAPAVADATKSIEEPAPSTDAIAEPAVAEAKPAEGGIVATSGVAEGKSHHAHVVQTKLTRRSISSRG